MSVQSVVDAELHVCAAAPATQTVSGFEALTFTEVGEVTDLGESGSTLGFAEHSALKDGITRPVPAFVTFNERTITMGYDAEDAGQALLESAVNGANLRVKHSFKIVLQSGRILYRTGYITGFNVGVPGGNSVVSATSGIRYDAFEVVDDPSA